MTTRTLADIEAEQAALEQEKAALVLPLLDEALTILEGLSSSAARLDEIRAALGAGQARDQIGHVLTVLTHAPVGVQASADAARALVQPAEPQGEPA